MNDNMLERTADLTAKDGPLGDRNIAKRSVTQALEDALAADAEAEAAAEAAKIDRLDSLDIGLATIEGFEGADHEVVLVRDNNVPGHDAPPLRRVRRTDCTRLSERALLIYTCTWNVYGQFAPEAVPTLLGPNRYHIYSIATQECERTIQVRPLSFPLDLLLLRWLAGFLFNCTRSPIACRTAHTFGRLTHPLTAPRGMVFVVFVPCLSVWRQAAALNPSHKKWEECVRRYLSPHYVMLRSHSLQAINLMIFVHRALVPDIHGIQSAVVATGVSLGGTTQMGNKGAVGISFNCHQHSFLFLSCHFAANQDMVEKRNADYHTIENCMGLFPTESVSRSNSARSRAASPAAWEEKPKNVRVVSRVMHSPPTSHERTAPLRLLSP